MARKTIWYKRVELGTLQSKDLQAVLSAALSQLPTTGQRLRASNPSGGGSVELINGHGKRYGMLCGHFIGFEEGHKQPYLKGLDSSASFDLDAIAPPKGKVNERREFLEGVCYFGVLKNHLIVCQSKATGTRQFERYLNWLLWDATSVLPKPTAVVLSDQPSKRLMEKLNKNPVKSVSFGTPVLYEPISVPETQMRVNKVRVTPAGLGADILNALFKESIFDNASFDQAIADDNIEVEVTVRFKHKQHISSAGESLLRSVAKAARHLDGDDLEIELHRAGTIKGGELKVHNSIDVVVNSDGLLKEDDLNQKMAQWIEEMLQSKMIDP